MMGSNIFILCLILFITSRISLPKYSIAPKATDSGVAVEDVYVYGLLSIKGSVQFPTEDAK